MVGDILSSGFHPSKKSSSARVLGTPPYRTNLELCMYLQHVALVRVQTGSCKSRNDLIYLN